MAQRVVYGNRWYGRIVLLTSGTCAQAHTRMTEKEVEEVEDEGREEEEEEKEEDEKDYKQTAASCNLQSASINQQSNSNRCHSLARCHLQRRRRG